MVLGWFGITTVFIVSNLMISTITTNAGRYYLIFTGNSVILLDFDLFIL
jgi:hypothetical protein